MPLRYYSSTAQDTTLTTGVNGSITTMVVAATTGFPGSVPYTLLIDPDTSSEEVVEVSEVSGTTLTVIRGADGTTGVTHLAGAKVKHGVSARDFREPNSFINGSGTVGSAQIADGAITSGKLADSAVTSAKIADGTIVNADISASAAIAASKLTGVVTTATATTKGDLLAATGNAAITRLGVGANGTVLTADSAESTGVKWAAPATGGGWELLGSATPSSGSTVTISWETTLPEDTFQIVAQLIDVRGGSAATLSGRFNGSSTGYNTTLGNNLTAYKINDIGTSSTQGAYGQITVQNTALPKPFTVSSLGGSGSPRESIVNTGFYNETGGGGISSMTFFLSTGTFAAGTIYVYGVR
jgi:hypothetical protein